MKSRKFKAYIRLTLTFTLIFAIVAATAFAVAINMMDGDFFGYNISGDEKPSSLNVLLLGVDKGGTRTDVIILAQLNLLNNSINMMQIPRDTYVRNNGRYDKKINSAWGSGGEKAVFREVTMATGLEIDKYIMVDTSQFRKIIDTIGGVEYNVPINMNYDDPVQDLHIHLDKGMQVLDGEKAEQFVRFRQNNNGTGYALGDVERLDAQKGFIKAAINQLFSVTNAFKIPKIVSMFSSMIETDFTRAQMISYAPYVFKTDMSKINIMTLPGEGRYIGGGSYYVIYENKLTEMIDAYFTPELSHINETELEIIQEVIGTESVHRQADDEIEAKKTFGNILTSIDIIDASDGVADVEDVKEKLEYYGYRVTGETETVSMINEKTQVVVSTDDETGDKISGILGVDSYTLNKKKSNGTKVTVILGKDME